MAVSAMFQTASTFWRPVKPPKLTCWLTSAAGCWLWPSNSATFWPLMKYCQFVVACRAVLCQVNVAVVPTGVTFQPAGHGLGREHPPEVVGCDAQRFAGLVAQPHPFQGLAKQAGDRVVAHDLCLPVVAVLEEVRQQRPGDAFVVVVSGGKQDLAAVGVPQAFDDRGQDARQVPG
ncbi:hypothetical protein GCM10010345_93890 [Streptomyces canarius]|uniref:Uncharacterized protein n=1 Tax=Streptomyces canarius TaxID=285453 RepID=A0ABQ3DDD7_9ACTN|nr:hypothetical protein GCM10010345_93890 [Streptomyces canarius]